MVRAPGAYSLGPYVRSANSIVATCKIDGNHRYSRIKNPRSLFVSRTWPGTLRRRTIN